MDKTVNNIETWQLEISFRVQCCNCFTNEDVFKDTREEAVKALESIGWQVRRIGPWCPECGSLLRDATRQQLRTINEGVTVSNDRGQVLGKVKSVEDGYAVITASDGHPSVYPLCELTRTV